MPFSRFLISLGLDLSFPTPVFEDNQGTIKLIKTSHLTNTGHNNSIKIAYLKEKLDEDAICTAYIKTSLIVVDCTTKPINGAQLSQQIFPTHDLHHYHDLDLNNYESIGQMIIEQSPPMTYILHSLHLIPLAFIYIWIYPLGSIFFSSFSIPHSPFL